MRSVDISKPVRKYKKILIEMISSFLAELTFSRRILVALLLNIMCGNYKHR